MIESLILAIKTGLSIWESKEKTKYMDKAMKLEKEYYEESNKERPCMATLDNIGFELQLLSRAFSAATQKQNAMDK